MKSLTRKQSAVLAYLKESIAANGYAPSFEEIANDLELRSLSTVHEHLTNLERKGHITRGRYVARGIQVVARDSFARDVLLMARDARYALDANTHTQVRSLLDAITVRCQRELGL